MSRTLQKSKSRRESGDFILVPKHILESQEYAALTPRAVKLLFDLFVQFNGKNNGDFTAAWVVMRRRGWGSKAMLYRSLKELLDAGWIVLTRRGGKAQLGARRICSLYGVTWKPIDPCDGKIEIQPTRVPLNAWRKIGPHVETNKVNPENRTATPPADHIGPDVKANPDGKPTKLAQTCRPSNVVLTTPIGPHVNTPSILPTEVVGKGVSSVPPEPEAGDPGPWEAMV